MTPLKTLARSCAVACLALLAVLATPACGGGGSASGPPARASVKAGNMPDGSEWNGVYYSQQYGYLHMTKEGKAVTGVWKSPKGAWGRMVGEVTGDLYFFEWEEHKIGQVGPNATTKGKGYFKYHRPEGENVNDELKGEWGLGENEVGHPWEAVKQRNMDPDPKSILEEVGAAGSETVGGGWDEKPEAPTPAPSGGEDDSVGIEDEE